MKRLLILTAGALLLAPAAGCKNCCNLCGGKPACNPYSPTPAYAAPACNSCSPGGVQMMPGTTIGSPTISPGPEVYTPAPR